MIIALCAFLFTAGNAMAVWIDYDTGGVDPGNVYTIKFPTWWDGTEYKNVRVGEHLLDFEQFEGQATGMFKDVAAYCIENQEVDYVPRWYDMHAINANSPERDKEAAWIYKEYGSFFNDNVSDNQKKYTQAAIWNVYMDDDYTLGSGDVMVKGWTSNWGSYYLKEGADDILDALLLYKDTDVWNDYDFSGVFIAKNDYSQDFIIPGGPGDFGSPVPVPGAVWLLGSGLVGLVGLRAKKRRS
jgi:hypothetical protein